MKACSPASILSSCVAACVFLSCAGQVQPSGGPPDTIAPTIVRTFPDTNAVRVETDRIELEFSEYVERRSLEESIFISPYLGDLEFDWSGRDVTIRFSEKLRRNTTYVVNIGTDVVDIRAKNRMGSGYTLAFATGDSIDRGWIGGRVFDAKPEGVMVFAFDLAGRNPDTLNPARLRPEYIMQTGSNGFFALSNLAYGTYRLFAVRDEYRNMLYDKEVDQFGVGREDIMIDRRHPRFEDVRFRLSREDTTSPFVASAAAVHRRQIEVRFNEPLDSLSVLPEGFSVLDTVKRTAVPLIAAFSRTTAPSVVGLITGTPLDSTGAYAVYARDVVDRAGNRLDTLHRSASFAGTARPDTVRVTVSLPGIRDSVRGVWPDRPLFLLFSEPVAQKALGSAVALRDSLHRPVAAALRWMNSTDALFIPDQPLRSRAWYVLTVVMDSVRDLRGMLYRDSVVAIRFETLDLRTTGSIAGTVVDQAAPAPAGRYIVTASTVDRNPSVDQTVSVDRPGKFAIDKLPEGRYSVAAYHDADSSGAYSYGRPFPFVPSERFTVYQDTVKVRARWGVEGAKLEFRR
jgi:uncharacterized protein (DUF2141 family)